MLATIPAAFSLTVLWLPPLSSLRIERIEDASELMVFVAIGFAISVLNEVRLQAKRRAEAAEKEMRRGRERRRGPPE
jgi:K+-sensing histidine kinase KdpD